VGIIIRRVTRNSQQCTSPVTLERDDLKFVSLQQVQAPKIYCTKPFGEDNKILNRERGCRQHGQSEPKRSPSSDVWRSVKDPNKNSLDDFKQQYFLRWGSSKGTGVVICFNRSHVPIITRKIICYNQLYNIYKKFYIIY
jgi:hypothetical protein